MSAQEKGEHEAEAEAERAEKERQARFREDLKAWAERTKPMLAGMSAVEQSVVVWAALGAKLGRTERSDAAAAIAVPQASFDEVLDWFLSAKRGRPEGFIRYVKRTAFGSYKSVSKPAWAFSLTTTRQWVSHGDQVVSNDGFAVTADGRFWTREGPGGWVEGRPSSRTNFSSSALESMAGLVGLNVELTVPPDIAPASTT